MDMFGEVKYQARLSMHDKGPQSDNRLYSLSFLVFETQIEFHECVREFFVSLLNVFSGQNQIK